MAEHSEAHPETDLPSDRVQVRGLRHRYGRNPVLKGLDFELLPGRVTAFVGRNGAGKSTTLNCMAGILCPTEGEVWVAGACPWRDIEARRRIGFLPERPPLYPQLSVREHLMFSRRLRGLAAGPVDELVDRFQLESVIERRAGNLSKGFRQRLGLAMALSHQPDLILLDEPGSGLDPVQRDHLRSLIRELGRNATVLYSTHMLNEALAVADDLLVLCDGQLRFSGTVDDLGPAAEADSDSRETRLLEWMSGAEVVT